MQQIYARTPMPKRDFNKVAHLLYFNAIWKMLLVLNFDTHTDWQYYDH